MKLSEQLTNWEGLGPMQFVRIANAVARLEQENTLLAEHNQALMITSMT